jgi:N-acetylglutamate synthase-like GNAT family acetyltransferase
VTTDSSEWSGGRRDALLAALAAARPTERHYYLDTVGVVPTKRRRETASALLAPVLATCDEGVLARSWRTQIRQTQAFIVGLGFEEIEPFRLPTGAPPVVSMWRTPS